MSDVRCYGLPTEEQEMRHVFSRESEAHRTTGGDYLPVEIGGKRFFVAEWAGWDHQEQERVAIELMYHLLHAGGAPMNEVDIDGHGGFCFRRGSGKREYAKTTSIPHMPSVHELYAVLHENLGYYRNNGLKGICQSDLVKRMKGALPRAGR